MSGGWVHVSLWTGCHFEDKLQGGYWWGGWACVSVSGCLCVRQKGGHGEERDRVNYLNLCNNNQEPWNEGQRVPVGGIMPGDMRPGTEWGMMCGFSGDVTLWVLFGGRPGLELVGRGRSERVRRCEPWG